MNTEIIHIFGEVGCAGKDEPGETGILIYISVAVVFFNIHLCLNKNIKCDAHPVSIIDSHGFYFKIREFCVIGTADRTGTQFDIMAVLYDIRFYGIEELVIKSAADVFLKRTVSHRKPSFYRFVSGGIPDFFRNILHS